jgi:hypothetical protein
VRAGTRIAAGVALSCVTLLACASAGALNFGLSPSEICGSEVRSNEVVERYTRLLNPTEGTTVTVGQSVTFTGESGYESPLRFMVASSPALLSAPDIDSGPGVAQPSSVYAFISTNATAIPRTIYWAASFTRTLKDCEGPPVTFTTPPRALTVVSAPVLLTPDLTPPHLSVSVGPLARLRARNATLAYQVSCSLTCTGTTTATVWIIRHGLPMPAPKLDLAPMSVSIVPTSGGSEQVAYRYRGRALRRLRRVLRSGARIELRISADASNPEAGVAVAQCTTKLSG